MRCQFWTWKCTCILPISNNTLALYHEHHSVKPKLLFYYKSIVKSYFEVPHLVTAPKNFGQNSFCKLSGLIILLFRWPEDQTLSRVFSSCTSFIIKNEKKCPCFLNFNCNIGQLYHNYVWFDLSNFHQWLLFLYIGGFQLEFVSLIDNLKCQMLLLYHEHHFME